MPRMTMLSVLPLVAMLTTAAGAKIVTKDVEYTHGDVALQGYVAYDDASTELRPGILVIHDWTGLQDYPKTRARKLAELGYVAFALDMYGKGIRPQNAEESSKQASIYRADRQLMRDRATAGLNELKKQPYVDVSRLAAIGYCFGGGTALELARSGADIKGVVSFHGNLDTPNPADAANIKCKILVCHGADDPYVPKEQVTAFWNEMQAQDIDWHLVMYGNAVHSFTHKSAGTDNSKGAAYNAKADMRSWRHMQTFYDELFK